MPRPEAAAFRQWVTSLEGGARPGGGGEAESGAAGAGAPAEPRGICERGARPAGARGREPRAAAGGRFGVWVRQHRRRAVGVAGAARALHAGGGEDQPAGARRSDAPAGDDRPTRVRRTCCRTIATSEDLPFGSRGGLAVRHHFPLDGEYAIKVSAQRARAISSASRSGSIAPTREDCSRQPGLADPWKSGLRVKAGPRLVGVAFVGAFDRTLPIDGRPAGVPVTSFEFSQSGHRQHPDQSGRMTARCRRTRRARARIFVCQPAARRREEAACAQQILSTLARRAYRRPVTDVGRCSRCWRHTRRAGRRATSRHGIKWALEAVLVSPKFLFRVEQDPASAAPGTPYRVSDLELASRLSFFLWSSIPDDELLDLAARGKLQAAGGARAAGASGCWPTRGRRRSSRISPVSGCICGTCGRSAPNADAVSGFRRQPAGGVPAARRSCSSHDQLQRRPQRAGPADGRLHVPERAAGAPLRHCRTSTAAISGA